MTIKRLPRKLKKKLGPSWREIAERDYHIKKIFNKNYEDVNAIFKESINN